MKTRYKDPVIKEAWESTKTGREFVQALASKNYTLAQGRKRLVVVDAHGKTLNPLRHLENVKTKDLRARLRDVDVEALPDANKVVEDQKKALAEEQKQNKAEQQKLADYEKRKPANDDTKNNEKEPLDILEIRRLQLDALKEKHQLQLERLKLKESQRIQATKKKLIQYHQLRERKQELKALHRKITEAPWWKRWLGLARKDQEAFAAKAKTYRKSLAQCRDRMTNAKQQARESINTLKSQQNAEYTRFLDAQEKRLTQKFENKSQSLSKDREIENRPHNRDGPSLGR